jgi:hypothetical protein
MWPMRRYLILLGLVPILAACRGTQAYTAEDLSQVRTAYAELRPVYVAFRHAFYANGVQGILRNYHLERQDCRIVDEVDQRDTIDPNVNLFFASAELDNMCNSIESAYVTWAKPHHYPLLKGVDSGIPAEIFGGTDDELKKMNHYLAHPASLA